MKTCVLIPIYNEGANIDKVVRGCRKYVESVIVVDDGSVDRSAEIAKNAGAFVIVHKVNQGKGAAIKTGFNYIVKRDWDAVIILDGDAQHDWNEIPKFIEAAGREDVDIVLGNRMGDIETMPWLRKVTNQFSSYVLTRMARQNIYDSQCGFRLLRSRVLPDLDLKTSKYDTESEMLIQAARKGYKIGHVTVKTIYNNQPSCIHPIIDTMRFFRVVFKNLRKEDIKAFLKNAKR